MTAFHIFPKSLLALLIHIFSRVATQDYITIVGILNTTSESTPSATTPAGTPSPRPTLALVDSDAVYQLLGCYNELPSFATERALGVTGSYISPIFTSPDALTVPLCLEACAAAGPPGRAGQQYIYAAVENIR
jgi:hypothetical protein